MYVAALETRLYWTPLGRFNCSFLFCLTSLLFSPFPTQCSVKLLTHHDKELLFSAACVAAYHRVWEWLTVGREQWDQYSPNTKVKFASFIQQGWSCWEQMGQKKKKKGFLTDFSFATKPVNCSSWSSASLHFQGCKGFTEIIVATPELCMHG